MGIHPEDGKHFILGDGLALLGAAFYGCYTTLLKFRIPHENRVDMPLFFGFVGLFCLLTFWIFIPVLSILGIEPFELPPSETIAAGVLVPSIPSHCIHTTD
jgi:solute carrier family 35, member F5